MTDSLFSLRFLTLGGLSLAAALCALSSPTIADEPKPAPEKVTFADHVLPIMRLRCGSCHNANDQKGGLTVDNYAALMNGGSSGAVIEPGDAGNSYLYSLVTHASEPKMPPNADKMPAAELATLEKWINLGAPETAGSSVAVKKKPSLTKIEVSNQRPADVAVPTRYFADPAIVPVRSNAVTALAVSPWASVGAMSGHQQVTLFDTKTLDLLGVLPFPEGQPQVLKFSRNGSLLLVGGGRGGANGRVVVFDVKTGERKIEAGDEYDEVLAADISPDQTLIALGGPKKVLRIYSTVTGELIAENKKHTDWLTAIEFSPDGVLVASGDRSNGLIVWEAASGNLFYDLQAHKGAISDISWRPDSNVVGSASEDGTIKLWEMQNGGMIKSWDAHPGGVTAMDYTRDGQLVSTGRDRISRLWNGDGAKVRDFPAVSDLGMEVAYDAEAKRLLAGDWAGKIFVWNADDAQPIGQLATNPPTIAMQLADATGKADAVRVQLAAKQKAAADLRAKLAARQQAADAATGKAKQAAEIAAQTTSRKQQSEKAMQTQQAAVTAAELSLKETQTAQAQLSAQLKSQDDGLTAAQNVLKTATEAAAQATAAEAVAGQALAAAKQKSDELTLAAKPTEAETPLLETDAQVKQAVADRLAAATAAQQAVGPAETALTAVQGNLQQSQKNQVAAKAAVDALVAAIGATQAAQATANTAAEQAQKSVEAARKSFDEAQAQHTAALQEEQTAAKALVEAQAAAKKETDAAPATPDEQKVLGETDAAVKAAQDQLAVQEARLVRLKKCQSDLTAAPAK
ncbi:c-type cytochrome domain-containing protein [Planctomicrobium piriforme]|uniref:WD40 repeat n=1 Tax=Planctomicrobium piriforme TaxID=1576369 RepID=A0A1I3BFT0_9PLAN|nr:c-type cytochrome domain-containing protein [Planctomicrobium piriforme]SFH61010.1 WD40 repeat [Planctomicrobium piriforme]